MEKEFNITRKSRELFVQMLQNHTPEQLNKIPDGWNNNLVWHIGHILVSQQILVYNGSGVEPLVNEELTSLYRRGTKPEREITEAEINEMKGLLMATALKTEEDYYNGIFTTYTARKSELGYELNDTEDAIAFNNVHEGIHMGMIIRLKRLV